MTYPNAGRRIVLIDRRTCRFARKDEIAYGEIREPFWDRFTPEEKELWAGPGMVSVYPYTIDTGVRVLFKFEPDAADESWSPVRTFAIMPFAYLPAWARARELAHLRAVRAAFLKDWPALETRVSAAVDVPVWCLRAPGQTSEELGGTIHDGIKGLFDVANTPQVTSDRKWADNATPDEIIADLNELAKRGLAVLRGETKDD